MHAQTYTLLFSTPTPYTCVQTGTHSSTTPILYSQHKCLPVCTHTQLIQKSFQCYFMQEGVTSIARSQDFIVNLRIGGIVLKCKLSFKNVYRCQGFRAKLGSADTNHLKPRRQLSRTTSALLLKAALQFEVHLSFLPGLIHDSVTFRDGSLAVHPPRQALLHWSTQLGSAAICIQNCIIINSLPHP